jgi:vitamin B12 transporter
VKNAFAHAAYRTKKAGEFGLQLASQMKDFGANSFYTKKFPNQFEHTQTQLAAFDWKLNVNNLKVTAQAYNRHALRPLRVIPNQCPLRGTKVTTII